MHCEHGHKAGAGHRRPLALRHGWLHVLALREAQDCWLRAGSTAPGPASANPAPLHPDSSTKAPPPGAGPAPSILRSPPLPCRPRPVQAQSPRSKALTTAPPAVQNCPGPCAGERLRQNPQGLFLQRCQGRLILETKGQLATALSSTQSRSLPLQMWPPISEELTLGETGSQEDLKTQGEWEPHRTRWLFSGRLCL